MEFKREIAPVLSTGPSIILIPFAFSSFTTSFTGVSTIKHRSIDPGVGFCAFGLNSFPN